MAMKYCCFTQPNGVTLIGILQLNAALYWLAEFSLFQKVYWPFYFVFALCYAARVYCFINGTFQKGWHEQSTRELYRRVNLLTTYAMMTVAAIYLIVNWCEWKSFPTGSFVFWLFVLMFNIYHQYVLASFSNDSDSNYTAFSDAAAINED